MSKWREAAGTGFAHNLFALYGVYAARYVVPLVTIPYLTRVLGASGWGTVAIAQGFGTYLTLLVEYGFNLSATREIARSRDNLHRIGEIACGVIGAKAILTLACILVTVLLGRYVPVFRRDWRLLWMATFAAITQSFSLLWLFQGLEKMKTVAALDVSAKLLTTVGIFYFVHVPADGWKVLALQAIGSLIALVAGLVLAARLIPVLTPTLERMRESLVMGWTMFLYRGSVTLYTVGNAFVLGLFAPPEMVGYYAGAEKISKAFLGLIDPASQALYPRLSYLAQHARHKAAQVVRTGTLVLGVAGAAMGIVIVASAPTLVRVGLGTGFEPSVTVLRILALLPIMIALSNVFGIQWMLPLGMDRPFNTIVVIAGALNLGLAVILARPFQHIGMAWAVVIAESFVTIAMYLWLRHRGVDPLARSLTAQPSTTADVVTHDA